MWPQPREGTGFETAVWHVTSHPLLLSSSGIKKLQLDKGFEAKAISALLWVLSQETCTMDEQLAWKMEVPRGFMLCADRDASHWVHSNFAFSRPQSL